MQAFCFRDAYVLAASLEHIKRVLGFRVLGFRVLGFRVLGLGCWDLGFWI